MLVKDKSFPDLIFLLNEVFKLMKIQNTQENNFLSKVFINLNKDLLPNKAKYNFPLFITNDI